MTEPIAVSINEAIRLSGVGRSTIYAEMKNKRLPIKKIGRRTVILMEDLKTWLASKTGVIGKDNR